MYSKYLEIFNCGFKTWTFQIRAIAHRIIFFVESKSLFELLRSNLGMNSTFPNVYVAHKIFLTLPVRKCEGERPFSALARIKNKLKLKSSMSQMKQNILTLLPIESELVKTIDNCYYRIFCNKEARKAVVTLIVIS